MDELDETVRRPRRAALGALGVIALAGAVVVGAVVAGRSDHDPVRSTAPVTDPTGEATLTPTPTSKPGVESPNDDCGHGDGLIDIFTTKPPPIDPDSLAQQRALIDRITSRTWSGFEVVGAEPTHLGVAAVVDRDYARAKEALASEGVRLVAVQISEVKNVHSRAMDAVQDQLEGAIRNFNRERQGLPGYAGIAVWQGAGAVVVNWKAPISDEVKALGGVRADGVNVIIQPVQYSLGDLHAARNRMFHAMDHHQVEARWTETYDCQDGSGLVVGVEPDSLGSRKAELESQLSDVAGVPVHVFPREPAEPLVLRVPMPAGTRTKGSSS